MKMRTRIMFLLLLVVFVFSFLTLGYRKIEEKNMKLLFANEKYQEYVKMDTIIRLQKEKIMKLAEDYTCWDDMVKFTQTVSKEWAVKNIDTILPCYNVDFVWVYNADKKQIYNISRLTDAQNSAISVPERIFVKLLAERRYHFHMLTKQGLVEIASATIHPTNDAKRKTEPKGYFFVGRLWDRKYMDEFGCEGGYKIESIAEADENIIDNTKDPKDGSLAVMKMMNWVSGKKDIYGDLGGDNAVVKMLKDIDGKDSIRTKLYIENNFVQAYVLSGKIFFIGFALMSVVILILFAFLIERWIIRPFKIITRSLETNDLVSLEKLKDKKNEYGIVARMIYEKLNNNR